jgi:anaerobic magnesium-protoporphyrin IX monomethyl ester cyclase
LIISSLIPPKYVRPVNPVTIDEAIDKFGATPDSSVDIQIIRPFAVYAANTYSLPLTVPIGPAYLAATLELAGHRVDVIDAISEGIHTINASPCGKYRFHGLIIDDILDRISDSSNILGISLMFSQEWVFHRELVNRIHERFPNKCIVVGGEHITALTEFVLHDCPAIDFAIAGEAELTLLEFVSKWQSNEDIKTTPGVSFIGPDGQFITGGLSNRISDFANLPRPAWHLCNIENFFTGLWSMGISYGRNILILATRGCPYQCSFCSNPNMWTTRYLMRPPAEVVDEIEWLISSYDCKSVEFADLTAIIKKEWILEFCRELKKRKLDIVWQLPSGTRSEALDREVLEAIYSAGCKYLVYAPESGSEETLRIIKKKINLRRLSESAQMAVEIGHTVKANLIIGFPHETRKHVYQTLLFILKLIFSGVHDCNVALFSPYPGSLLFDQFRSDGTISKLDDTYFNGLMGQFDITSPIAYCQAIGPRELSIYRLIGMAMFYGLSYLVHPSRLFQVGKILLKKNVQPENLFEQRIKDYLGRKVNVT